MTSTEDRGDSRERSRNQRIREVFWRASELAPGQRESFVHQACDGDEALAAEVLELLRLDSSDSSFLRAPALDEHATLLEGAETEPPMPDDTRIGPYRIESVLGEGGMGTVYAARESGPLDRAVALKVIKGSSDSREIIRRFELERRVLARMTHAHIARIYDAGSTDDGRPYFAMEYSRGKAITTFADDEQLDLDSRIRVFLSVCDAVHHAHQRGVIHRDLKPSNVLVSLEDGVPTPKVIDFGVAKAVSPELNEDATFTQVGSVVGTPAYMSPEQARMETEDLDIRTDVYSLSVLLYELLVGALPFDTRSRSPIALQHAIATDDPPRASTRLGELGEEGECVARNRSSDLATLRRRIRGDLDWILQKGLATERTRRYTSASELGADLRRYLDGHVVTAGPPSLSYQLSKIVRRHRLLATGAVLFVLTLAVATIISARLYIQTRDALVRSEALRLTAEANAARSGRFADPDLALLLALEGTRRHETAETRKAVLAALGGFIPHRALLGHEAPVEDSTFSPDGRRCATASLDGTVRIWTTDDRRLETVIAVPGGATRVAFRPDGRHLACGGTDGVTRVCDVDTGKEVRRLGHRRSPVNSVSYDVRGERLAVSLRGSEALSILEEKTGEIAELSVPLQRLRCSVIHPDGRFVLAGGANIACVVEIDSKRIVVMSEDLRTEVHTVLWSPEGKRFLAASFQEAVIVSMETGTTNARFSGHKRFLHAAAWSADGRHVATGGDGGAIKIWEAATGKLRRELDTYDNPVLSLDFDPAGRLLASGTDHRMTRVWEVASGEHRSTLVGHRRNVTSVNFSPDGAMLLTSSLDQLAVLWDVTQTHSLLPVLPHDDRVRFFAISPNGKRIATACDDGVVRLWNRRTGELTQTLTGHRGYVSDVRFRSNEEVLTAGQDADVRVWNLKTGKRTGRMRHSARPDSIELSSDGKWVLTRTSEDAPAELWDIERRERAGFFPPGKPCERSGFSPDGGVFFTAAKNEVLVWNSETLELELTLSDHAAAVRQVRFSNDGRRLATASSDKTAGVYDRKTGSRVYQIEHSRVVYDVVFSPDSRRLATAVWGSEVAIHDARDGRHLRTLEGHTWRTTAVVFSPDGARLLTTSFDQTARIWDVETGTELLRFEGHENRVETPAAFTPDGEWAVTLGRDFTVRAWPIDPLTLAETHKPRDLSDAERRAYGIDADPR